MTDILGVVPARGGSQGIRRKNLMLVDGKPLVLHAADTLSEVCDRVVITTDDDLIASVAGSYEVHRRPTVDASQTVLQAVETVVADLDWAGPVACLQPTCPDITADMMRSMMGEKVAAQMGYTDTHLIWHGGRSLSGHVNRQDEADWPVRTVGAYWWPTEIYRPAVVVPFEGAITDVDSWADLQTVRHKPKRILIRYVANQKVGSGHVRRMLTLADGLQGHNVLFHPTEDTDGEWVDLVDYPQTPWFRTTQEPDLVITDTLGTTPYIGQPWITFEDITPESNHADLVVNALYKDTRPNTVSGQDWVVVRPEYAALPEFEVAKEGRSVLVMFGGTDPSRLVAKTSKVFQIEEVLTRPLARIDQPARVTIVGPGDNRPIAELMQTHDLLITSAGRTVYEAALVGIPTIVTAQNSRESTHQHLGFEHGNVYLGLGRLVSEETLGRTVRDVLADYDLRLELSQAEGPDGRGLDRIVHRITGILEGIA